MTLINCRGCGKLTIDHLDGYCPECGAEREKLVSLIKDFLMVNRNAGVMEIVRETKISSKLVFELIREGRIGIS